MVQAAPATRSRRRPVAPFLIFATAFLAVAVLGCTFFLFRTFNIPSGSNIPTLQVGDIIVASKLPYGYSRFSFPVDLGFRGRVLGGTPQRGDVVVFKLPRDNRTDYVKRVIGLPGDAIQMKEGRLYINGTMVPREPIARARAEDDVGTTTEVPTYRETLPGGSSHTIIEIQGDTGFNDNTDVYDVPSGHYFVMGDNRDNSLDSRVPPEQGGVGYVPLDNFIARAEFVIYNSGKPDRMFKPIH